jgi:hypothetical protein
MSRLLMAAVAVMVVAVAFTEVLAVFMAVAFMVDTLSAAFVVTRVFMAVNFTAIASAFVRV